MLRKYYCYPHFLFFFDYFENHLVSLVLYPQSNTRSNFYQKTSSVLNGDEWWLLADTKIKIWIITHIIVNKLLRSKSKINCCLSIMSFFFVHPTSQVYFTCTCYTNSTVIFGKIPCGFGKLWLNENLNNTIDISSFVLTIL